MSSLVLFQPRWSPLWTLWCTPSPTPSTGSQTQRQQWLLWALMFYISKGGLRCEPAGLPQLQGAPARDNNDFYELPCLISAKVGLGGLRCEPAGLPQFHGAPGRDNKDFYELPCLISAKVASAVNHLAYPKYREALAWTTTNFISSHAWFQRRWPPLLTLSCTPSPTPSTGRDNNDFYELPCLISAKVGLGGLCCKPAGLPNAPCWSPGWPNPPCGKPNPPKPWGNPPLLPSPVPVAPASPVSVLRLAVPVPEAVPNPPSWALEIPTYNEM